MAQASAGTLSVDLSHNKLITRAGVVAVVNSSFALEFTLFKVVRGEGAAAAAPLLVKRISLVRLRAVRCWRRSAPHGAAFFRFSQDAASERTDAASVAGMSATD